MFVTVSLHSGRRLPFCKSFLQQRSFCTTTNKFLDTALTLSHLFPRSATNLQISSFYCHSGELFLLKNYNPEMVLWWCSQILRVQKVYLRTCDTFLFLLSCEQIKTTTKTIKGLTFSDQTFTPILFIVMVGYYRRIEIQLIANIFNYLKKSKIHFTILRCSMFQITSFFMVYIFVISQQRRHTSIQLDLLWCCCFCIFFCSSIIL
jgi:hypothetical protein